MVPGIAIAWTTIVIATNASPHVTSSSDVT